MAFRVESARFEVIAVRGDLPLIYYKRFPGDYLRDTVHLSAIEDGMYGRLLDAFYTSEKPLPLERKTLFALVRARTADERRAVESVLRQFFKKTARGFTNSRAIREIKKAVEISEKRASAAKQKTKQSANAEHLQSKLVTPDSRLHSHSQTPDSSFITSSQDQPAAAVHSFPPKSCGNGAAAAAAFTEIGFDNPFGQPSFQAEWVTRYLEAKKNGTWLTATMEETIQACQKMGIGIPPQFYEAKHDVEKKEMQEWNRRHRSGA